MRSPYTVRKHKIAWLIIFLLIAASVGVWLRHRSKTGPLADAGVESRYIEGYSANHPKPVVVVFVHGIFGNDTTWGKGDLTLPHLLATDPDLQKTLDLLLFEYQSPWLRNAGKIPALAEQLYGALEDNGVWTKHQKVIFVAHSMGGLIVRQYIIAHQDHIPQIPIMYFYSVPTNGAMIADVARRILNNPQLNGMVPLEGNDYLDAVTNIWMDKPQLSQLPTRCAYELQDTDFVRIVPESSARALCTEGADPLDANHIEIVKPRDRADSRFTRLATTIRRSLQASSAAQTPSQTAPPATSHPPNRPAPSPSRPAPTDKQITCQQAIEVCSNSELMQRAFIMQQKLKKFAGDWQVEEESSRSWAQQMEANHQKLTGDSSQLQPLPPGSSQKEREEWSKRLGFETWLSNSRIEVFEKNRKNYNDQFRTDALQIRDELVNRYPPARTLSGYRDYVDLGSYSQVFTVVAHLGACIDALRNKP